MTYSQTWGTPQERHPIRRFLAELEMAGCVNLGVAFVKRVALGNATRLKSYSSAQRIYTLRELACSVGPVGTTGSVAVPVCHTLPQALAWANTPKTFPMWRSEHARASSFPMQEVNRRTQFAVSLCFWLQSTFFGDKETINSFGRCKQAALDYTMPCSVCSHWSQHHFTLRYRDWGPSAETTMTY